jgi:hypothetical protein
MRVPGRLIAFAAIGLVLVGTAGGQQFGGFGFGGKKGTSYSTLAANAQVREELKITNDQVAKLPAAEVKALSEVLDAGQMKRLKQIYLQQRGNTAYLETEVKKELKITDEQVKKIQSALEKQAKETLELQQGGGFNLERFQEIQKEATDAVQATLTADQKTAWTKMVGAPFEMQFGFGKKKQN